MGAGIRCLSYTLFDLSDASHVWAFLTLELGCVVSHISRDVRYLLRLGLTRLES